MKTPAGKECKFFYGDYYRGRNREECRLLEASSQQWTSDLCFTCPVPEILQANACENMVLGGSVEKSFPFLKRKVRIKAYCQKTNRPVTEPHIGCGECHPLPPIFSGDTSDFNTPG
jgi:hypothetical protein